MLAQQSPSRPDSGGRTITVSGAVNAPRLAELRTEWLGRLEGEGPVRLDLSSVTELDLPGLQLVLSVQAWASARSLAFSMVSCEAVDEFAEAFGVSFDAQEGAA
jgi:ABC-type transporter Mla MlaB component